MIAAHSSRAARVLMIIAAGLSSSCSAYFNPTADLVLHVADADAGHRVVVTLEGFARERGLKASSARDDGPQPESIRQLKEKTTYYLSGTRHGIGRSLTFFDASPGCKVVQLVERSEKWSEQSEADLQALRAALTALAGVTVESGARFAPNTESKRGRPITDYCPGDVSSQIPAA